MPPAKFNPTGDSPIPVFPVASAACSGLGWAGLVGPAPEVGGDTLSWQISACPSSLHSPNPTQGREREEAVPSVALAGGQRRNPAENGTYSSPSSCLLMPPPTHCSHTP